MNRLKHRRFPGVVRADDQINPAEVMEVAMSETSVVFECQGSDHAKGLPARPFYSESGPEHCDFAHSYLRQTKADLQPRPSYDGR